MPGTSAISSLARSGMTKNADSRLVKDGEAVQTNAPGVSSNDRTHVWEYRSIQFSSSAIAYSVSVLAD